MVTPVTLNIFCFLNMFLSTFFLANLTMFLGNCLFKKFSQVRRMYPNSVKVSWLGLGVTEKLVRARLSVTKACQSRVRRDRFDGQSQVRCDRGSSNPGWVINVHFCGQRLNGANCTRHLKLTDFLTKPNYDLVANRNELIHNA